MSASYPESHQKGKIESPKNLELYKDRLKDHFLSFKNFLHNKHIGPEYTIKEIPFPRPGAYYRRLYNTSLFKVYLSDRTTTLKIYFKNSSFYDWDSFVEDFQELLTL